MNLLFSLSLLGILLVMSAFLSGAETALFSLSRMERRRILDRHPHFGALVNDLLTHPRRVLITLMIAINVVSTAAAAIVTLIGLDFWGGDWVSLVVLVFTFILVFVGEIVPKIFAVRHNERIALALAPFLEVLSWILFPLRWLIQLVTDQILRLLIPERREAGLGISQPELKTLVKIGEEEGIIDRSERRMIQKLFELGEKPVRSIMTPRTDLVALGVEDPREKHLEIMKSYHFSHFPVYQENLDQILGVVSTQEVVLGEEDDFRKFIKPAVYIPELKRIDDLLRDFQNTKDRFAVCVDEFGGTAGIVTLEDVLEEIFGEFYDEYAKPEPSIRPLVTGEYLVDAIVPMSHFNEFFQAKLESEEAKTLGGFILEKMGRVPRKGEVLTTHGFQFRIHDRARQRLLKIVVRPQT